MKYQLFTKNEHSEYPIAILTQKLQVENMVKEYVDPFTVDPEELIAYELYQTGKKTKVSDQKEFLDELLPMLSDMETKYILVSDGDYFKTLTGVNKADAYLGYVLPNKYPEALHGEFNVIFCPNHRQVFYDPKKVRAKIQMAMAALYEHQHGSYTDPGHGLLEEAHYPTSVAEIGAWLERLLEMDKPLACDIEAFSLKHHSAGIGSVALAWSRRCGIAFPVDIREMTGPGLRGEVLERWKNEPVRKLLKSFFERCTNRQLWHNISYDVTVLIHQLFMDHITDTEGLLTGLEVMLKNWDDTKLITYLATNSCAGNELGLKAQAQEFAGNYAVEEIKNILKLELPKLLEYNLIDACSTWYVYEKHWETVLLDQQLEIYTDLFKPAIIDIIHMQLCGMPLNMAAVKAAKVILEDDRNKALSKIKQHPYIIEFTHELNVAWVAARNAKLKTKVETLDNAKEEFNPNSPPQMQRLFYELLELPVIERTKTKQPAVGSEILEKLKAYTEDRLTLGLIDAILDFKAVDKITSTFIPPMENAILGEDGAYYLFGNFNLGGTVSGRLSSSDPNLQTIPANGTKYAKLIKGCFQAPKGYLKIGLDFASLEDRISALTTKDHNKLKVYTDGFDGHCLRAFAYFRDQMPDIEDTVESINSIQEKYKTLRQDSKMPTFALTYQGTYITLMAKGGFSEIVAKQIEANYHELYKESDAWVAAKLDEASKVGYITAAFGLRVRTPLLHQVIRGNRATPFEAEAEGRTAGNALGQSWCLLNTRASVEFLRKARASKFRTKIRPIAHIHDAQYFIIPDDIEVLKYVNDELVKAVEWQDHPDIQHDQVKLGGQLSLFYPSWAEDIELPNRATEDELMNVINAHFEKKKQAKEAA